MSTDWSHRIWTQSCQTGSAKLLLLAIADAVGEDGSTTDLTILDLMQRVGAKERSVQALLGKLEQAGELRRDVGVGPHGRNRYTLTLKQPHANAVDVEVQQKISPTPSATPPAQVTASPDSIPRNGAGESMCTLVKEGGIEGARVEARPREAIGVMVLAPPDEQSLPADPLTLWRAGRTEVRPLDESHLLNLASELDKATGGYGCYWLGRAILAAHVCDTQFAINPRGLNLLRAIVRRWCREHSYGSDTPAYTQLQKEQRHAPIRHEYGRMDVPRRRAPEQSRDRTLRWPSTAQHSVATTACTIIGYDPQRDG